MAKRILSDILKGSTFSHAFIKASTEALTDAGSEDVDRDITALSDPCNKDLLRGLMIEARKGMLKTIVTDKRGSILVQLRCTMRMDEIEELLVLRVQALANHHGLNVMEVEESYSPILTSSPSFGCTLSWWSVGPEGAHGTNTNRSTSWINSGSYLLVRSI